MAEDNSSGGTEDGDRDAEYEQGFEEIVEDERRRLMTAEAVLGCAIYALDGAEGATEEELPVSYSDFALVMQSVRDMVSQTIIELDSVNILRRVRGIDPSPDAVS